MVSISPIARMSRNTQLSRLGSNKPTRIGELKSAWTHGKQCEQHANPRNARQPLHHCNAQSRDAGPKYGVNRGREMTFEQLRDTMTDSSLPHCRSPMPRCTRFLLLQRYAVSTAYSTQLLTPKSPRDALPWLQLVGQYA
jgi:hypothetical protein